MSKKQSTSQEISRESTAPNAFKKYGTWCILIGILIAIGIFMNREFDLIPSKISDTVDSTSKSVILGMSEPTDSIEKISYDTKILSIALDTPIATGSISRESVTLSPALSGTVSVSSDQKTISYTLQSPLIIGESYELRVAWSVEKADGKSLGKDAVVEFLVTAWAQAVKIFPTGSLDTLSQTITVVFNTPMVPLTNLDERDRLPCPLMITPKVEGKCSWTNTSILEFIPTKPLQWATRYQLQVTSTPGLLHTLSATLTGEIMTTPLRVALTNSFSPQDGLTLTTNFPVSLDELLASTALYRGFTVTASGSIQTRITPEKNEDGTPSETRFRIIAQSQPFTYNTDYTLRVHTTLRPKYGTEPLAQEVSTPVHTTDFVTNLWSVQNMFDHSGTLINTRESAMSVGMVPSERLFFLVDFDTEIPLDRTLMTLRWRWGDKLPLDFDIAYGKTLVYDQSGAITKSSDNRYEFKITPKAPLKKDTDYQLVFLKKASSALSDDEVHSFHTAPELVLSGWKLLSNTQACIYTNNKIENSDDILPTLSTVPVSKVPTLSYDYGMDRWSSDGQNHTTVYVCPQVNGQNAYIVDLRLNPNLAYTMNFLPTLTDEYGQTLSKTVSYTSMTGPIAMKDRYLYSSAQWGQTQVIPSNLPIVLGLLSVNSDTTNIEICEMDQAGYIAFLEDQRRNAGSPDPQCVKKSTKKIALKNRYWTTTPTQVDLEKEVLGHTFSTPYVYIHGYLDNSDPNLQQSFSHIFIRSNLSLTFEDGKDRHILFASSYDGKSIPPDLSFEAYHWIEPYGQSGHYEKIVHPPIAYSAAKQLYTFSDADLTIDLLVAKNSKYYGVLNFAQDVTSNYDFKYISGMDATTRDYLYVYPDRPLYQLGDSVSFKWILRSYHPDGYHPSEIGTGTIKILWGQWTVSGEVTIAEMEVSVDANSNIHGAFILPRSAPLGRYSFEFTASGSDGPMTNVYNNGEFFIEAYKKPVFKVTSDAPKPDVMIGDRVDIHSHAEYYFGWALASADYQYSILAQNYYFNPREYSNYSFSQGSAYMDCLYWGSCEYHDTLDSSGTGKLDTKGDATVHHDYKVGETTGEQIYTYSMEVTDPDTQKTVNQSVSQIVHATDAYVGVTAPYWNSGKSGVKMSGVVLDYNSKWIAGKTVGLELVKREWKNVKKQGVDGVFYNEGSIEETLIEHTSAKSDARGELTHTFVSATGGEYEIRATYTGSNNQSFVSSVMFYVSWGDEMNSWYDGNNAIADITPDTTLLSIGDRAGFTLKTPIQSGKMLVSIEKDDGILDVYVQDITDTTSRIEFPILDSYIPNVYVKVFALGQNPLEKLPIYKRALTVVKVLPDPRKLSVTVTTEKKKYVPGESVKVSVMVKDANGKWVPLANGSLSVVDESLLALAGNPLKNPFAYFYDMKRYLGVVTYTSLLNLVQKLEVKDVSLGEKWGAGEGQKGWLSKKKRWVFRDTAYWLADFTTDNNGMATITTPALPDNLTTWVIESVINTRKSEVGIATTHIQTSKNVVINDNLPRFLGTADTVDIAPVIFNKTDKDATFDISITATNTSLQTAKKSVEIKAWAQVSVPFELTVDGIEKLRSLSPRASRVTIEAISRVTQDQDAIELTIPIIETTTREMVATSGRADPKAEELIALSSAIRANGGSLTISYAATLLPGLLSGLDFLSNYPYGCIEQKLATIMPQVYLKALYDSIGMPYALDQKFVKMYLSKEEWYRDVSLKDSIGEIVQSISSYQNSDGGFGYWGDSSYSDLTLTLSVVERLQDLARIGFMTAPEVQSEAAKYIKNVFYTNNRPFCSTYCEYTLSERLRMIAGVLDAAPDDYEAYKMYQILLVDIQKEASHIDLAQAVSSYTLGVDFSLAHIHLLERLAKLTGVSEAQKKLLLTQVRSLIEKIASEGVVINPRWAFIGRSGSYTRLNNTLAFVEVVTSLGGNALIEHQTLLDQMTRWIMSEKQSDGSWGSTLDTTTVIRAITTLERSTGNIRNTDLIAGLTLDENTLESHTINAKNPLETFSTWLTLDRLQESTRIGLQKSGTGRIYYDIALEYALRASTLAARDEGFFLETAYYDYASYQVIERAKAAEWIRYMNNEILYTDLKYPDESTSYLTPITSLKVGSLVLVHNRMITPEPRDQVAFEGFIPAGAELVNPDLKTESQDVRNSSSAFTSLFDHEEWQDDRYFATKGSLDAWVYTFNYILRPTHRGIYELRPSRLSEFYHSEVFGRTAGRSITIGD